MSKTSVMEFVKKYTMILVLILVTAFFAWQTDGKILLPQNINNLIAQNAYVFVLATGMLLCILTGGNIDLSVGSVVCFVGAVGATMMETYEMNMWVSILVMLLVGLVIGAWQGFWIAFVRIPPFITTLSGMLVFRGLSNVVLNGMTVSITNQTFIRIFGGGADCYVPDFFGGNGFNITCMLAGVIACVIYALLTFRGYFARKKKGYETGSFNAMLAKVDCTLRGSSVVHLQPVSAQGYSGSSDLGDYRSSDLRLHHFHDHHRTLFLRGRRQREGHQAFRYQYR